MTTLKKHLQRARANPRVPIAVLCVTLVIAGLALLGHEARRETDARKSADVLQFETTPDTWLANQRNVSEFVKASDAGQLAAVGVANAHPGLLLYTLKNGTRASVNVPGCTVLGCAGTALDKLGE